MTCVTVICNCGLPAMPQHLASTLVLIRDWVTTWCYSFLGGTEGGHGIGPCDVQLRGASRDGVQINCPRIKSGALEDTSGDPHLAVHLQQTIRLWVHEYYFFCSSMSGKQALSLRKSSCCQAFKSPP